MQIETIKVKPWGEDQGDYVLINADDFDPKIHKPFEAGGGAPSAPRLEDEGEQPAEPKKRPAKRKARK